MTNPISKAIVKAAVAMGYGKKSDYKGSSVADVLEKFVAIAKDKGGSGGGVMVVNMIVNGNSAIADKTVAEIHSAAQNGCVIFVGDLGDGHLPTIGTFEGINYDSHYQAYLIETGIGTLYARTESDYPGTAL